MKMSSLVLPVIMLTCAKANGGNEMLRMCGKALLVALGKICNHNYVEHKSMNGKFFFHEVEKFLCIKKFDLITKKLNIVIKS